MSRKIAIAAVTGVAALSLAVTGASLAAATPAVHASSHKLRFASVETAQKSFGATTFVSSDRDVRNGKVIGYDVVHVVFHPKTNTFSVTVAATFKAGTLYLVGTGSGESADFSGRITGGTGVFRGAHGTVAGRAYGAHDQNEKLVVDYH